jgi:hypothetical protein
MKTEFIPLGGSAKKVSETEKAILLEWNFTGKYVEDTFQVKEWLPKQFVSKNEYGTYQIAEWLYRKLDKKYTPSYWNERG